MKERIYTIPLNDALDKGGECPLCDIAHNVETNALEYIMGAAVMEPDVREQTNKLGFCAVHLGKMLAMPGKLPLALLLDTRLNTIIRHMKQPHVKRGLFRKHVSAAEDQTCFVCARVCEQMEACIENLAFLFNSDDQFRQRILCSKGFCMTHFAAVCQLIADEQQLEALFNLQKQEMQRINDEVNLFTKKYDYHNESLPWGNAKDSPARAAGKIV